MLVSGVWHMIWHLHNYEMIMVVHDHGVDDGVDHGRSWCKPYKVITI